MTRGRAFLEHTAWVTVAVVPVVYVGLGRAGADWLVEISWVAIAVYLWLTVPLALLLACGSSGRWLVTALWNRLRKGTTGLADKGTVWWIAYVAQSVVAATAVEAAALLVYRRNPGFYLSLLILPWIVFGMTFLVVWFACRSKDGLARAAQVSALPSEEAQIEPSWSLVGEFVLAAVLSILLLLPVSAPLFGGPRGHLYTPELTAVQLKAALLALAPLTLMGFRRLAGNLLRPGAPEGDAGPRHSGRN